MMRERASPLSSCDARHGPSLDCLDGLCQRCFECHRIHPAVLVRLPRLNEPLFQFAAADQCPARRSPVTPGAFIPSQIVMML
ncbi:hypothetical protein [Streptomyces sp. NBC_00233]|uniref:hypothetical protein n=1 Tax=Streptomyces sp. NBC_00233 TaxID=2975686 RepID=UPI00224D892C|nr:hypothetical protein [Streptomyces sp. NBC_00233]MCX5233054.1 hypothetical protein [Streptomyces sp. NBC_00233]